MTEITKDFDEIWLHPTPKGMAFSIGGNEQVASVHLRVIIEANTRDDWHIDEVHMITFEYKHKTRSGEYVHVLEGDFLQAAKDYLYAAYADEFQDAVNLEILDDGETVGYEPLRAQDVVDCGRRM
jgi:hypothetical protein